LEEVLNLWRLEFSLKKLNSSRDGLLFKFQMHGQNAEAEYQKQKDFVMI